MQCLPYIPTATAEIWDFTAGGRSDFMSDRKTQSAVIRQIEIIGEAVKNLSVALTAGAPGVPWHAIAGSRDRLIHAYYKVDLDMVWAMVERDLPRLRADPQHLLSMPGG